MRGCAGRLAGSSADGAARAGAPRGSAGTAGNTEGPPARQVFHVPYSVTEYVTAQRPRGWSPVEDRLDDLVAALRALPDRDPAEAPGRWTPLVLRILRHWWRRIIARLRRRELLRRSAPLVLAPERWGSRVQEERGSGMMSEGSFPLPPVRPMLAVTVGFEMASGGDPEETRLLCPWNTLTFGAGPGGRGP